MYLQHCVDVQADTREIWFPENIPVKALAHSISCEVGFNNPISLWTFQIIPDVLQVLSGYIWEWRPLISHYQYS